MIRVGLSAGICMLVAACATTQHSTHSQDRAILDDLREGGFVIFFMHAATDPAPASASNDNDCSTQPRLNGLGKTQAKVIGKSLRKLKIPVGGVVASSYCPSIKTAKLAFRRATPAADITLTGAHDTAEIQRRALALKNMLAQAPTQGTNTVIVGHAVMLKALHHIELEDGEAAIFKPDGKGSAELISLVKANGWQTLVSRVYDSDS